MAHPPGLGRILARRAARIAGRPKIERPNRRAAQDRKFGPVEKVLPPSVKLVADWQLYRQKQVYARELNTSVGAGLRGLFRWNVPIDRAWLVRGVTFNTSGPALPGNIRLQIQIPRADNTGFSSFIIGLLPMPMGAIPDDRVINFVGAKADTPFFAPGEPFYVPTSSNVIVEMLVPAPAISTIGAALLAYELPPTEDVTEIVPDLLTI